MKLSSLPLAKQQALAVFIVSIISVVAFILEQLIGNSFTELFVYQKQLIGQGEIWRLITGHFLHTNGFHLLLNLAALLMLWLLHGRFYNLKNYSFLFLFTALITSLSLYYFTPAIQQYVGLSGVLHGVFVFGVMMDIKNNDKTGYLLFIGVWLKISHEQIYGASEDVSAIIEASVAIDAHLWGALAGLLFAILYWLMADDIQDDLSINS